MATTDLLLIGRQAELRRLQENVAKGRHSLLVGKVGLGKSHLLRVLTRELPRSIYLDQVRPLRLSLLDLCQALHTRRDLALTAPDAPWPEEGRFKWRRLLPACYQTTPHQEEPGAPPPNSDRRFLAWIGRLRYSRFAVGPHF